MQFPANLNFNLHGGYDMGLYFAHRRWYNQDTGLWLSPNEKGDYLYGGDGQDPVNVAPNPSTISEGMGIDKDLWIVEWLKEHRNELDAAANRHSLLPEFLGAVLYLENNNPLENQIRELRKRILGIDLEELAKFGYNLNPGSDSGSRAYIELLQRQKRIFASSQGIGAIKPDVAARIEALGLLYDPFTESKTNFVNSREPWFIIPDCSITGDIGPIHGLDIQYVYIREHPLARFEQMGRLMNDSWRVEYLAAHLDSARYAPGWPKEVSVVVK